MLYTVGHDLNPLNSKSGHKPDGIFEQRLLLQGKRILTCLLDNHGSQNRSYIDCQAAS